MQKANKEKILNMIESGIFDAELLIKCIAKINIKVARKYRQVKKYEDFSEVGNEQIHAYNLQEFDDMVQYRKPILDTLMKTYRFSLEEVKALTKKANYDDLPTYKMIEAIRNRILSGDYMCM